MQRPIQRYSLGSAASAPNLSALGGTLSSKENNSPVKTDGTQRKKRALSLGGERLSELAGGRDDLSPRKKARRSLVRRRLSDTALKCIDASVTHRLQPSQF